MLPTVEAYYRDPNIFINLRGRSYISMIIALITIFHLSQRKDKECEEWNKDVSQVFKNKMRAKELAIEERDHFLDVRQDVCNQSDIATLPTFCERNWVLNKKSFDDIPKSQQALQNAAKKAIQARDQAIREAKKYQYQLDLKPHCRRR